jgi:hypothetical protein
MIGIGQGGMRGTGGEDHFVGVTEMVSVLDGLGDETTTTAEVTV